ncbi:50S ribosomal protein L23 [Thermosulfuriphilus ammonigenes]|uniref:Large ribosomal subunit protein uL23 n=1 Tax=Thermosulfuriphilus ammonigenes TaxID=1936021 RepID=A0A6G7PUH0_9BACT|nr:50S ribosomal protein L23 [Thermosulfuriphilus ammonigenes]MBA2848521.1 large subunit ribosomal protein L23 [Thermosulfuriphilus ammonigenes]QIJ71334.1 50S ribosomal protein L23 [Thermosulfuriphilus ammonigenes]
MKNARDIIIRPLITEKALRQKEEANQVCFEVARSANKIEIKKAVEEIFKVAVEDVQTIVVKGKPKRLGRFAGRRSTYKKAIVRLAPGHTIEFFETV